MGELGYSLGQPYGVGLSFQRVERVANPGAQADAVFRVAGDYRRRLIACVFTLTTDANVANRYTTVECQDSDGNAYCVNGAAVVVTANTTQRYAGAISRGQAEWATGTDILIPLAPVFLNEGNVVKIHVAAMQAGDALTAIRLTFDCFPTAESALPAKSD